MIYRLLRKIKRCFVFGIFVAPQISHIANFKANLLSSLDDLKEILSNILGLYQGLYINLKWLEVMHFGMIKVTQVENLK